MSRWKEGSLCRSPLSSVNSTRQAREDSSWDGEEISRREGAVIGPKEKLEWPECTNRRRTNSRAAEAIVRTCSGEHLAFCGCNGNSLFCTGCSPSSSGGWSCCCAKHCREMDSSLSWSWGGGRHIASGLRLNRGQGGGAVLGSRFLTTVSGLSWFRLPSPINLGLHWFVSRPNPGS